MSRTRCVAALAALSLLALAACGGGGGSSPQTGDSNGDPPVASPPDPDPPSRAETIAADPERGAKVAADAATSLPRFGSVTQSTSHNVAGISTDAASTRFDGRNLILTVARQDASRLVLSTGRHAVETSDRVASPVPGHVIQSAYLFDYSDTSATVALTAVSWDSDDSAEYLAGGYWLHVEGSIDPPSLTSAEIGAFVDGPELSSAPSSMPVSGTASYAGPTQGVYGAIHGTDTGDTPGSVELGEFASIITLTADFEDRTIGGCVGCASPIIIAGVFEDAASGQIIEFYDDSGGVRVLLGATPFESNGTFRSRSVRLESDHFTVTRSQGAWGGRFSSIANADGNPRLVAGTLGGEGETAGGSELAYVGAYFGTAQ